ncbi:hypothetical protein BEL04_04870 [Mucilaginibacter sp. PPCGB 2223]|uniref:hypothetical protein n=1 Tax=Mucilaginibacter sp. PPCGB 2223 TaxID=1886027 RepID=UPI000826CA28|nr:hypothetical protein [Mucilaginibacter sp. PPCGB 2223]OCX53630.1 hypothetical protein BEL04_04870 [Mucilaginibacter sp. PPCGB 2223]
MLKKSICTLPGLLLYVICCSQAVYLPKNLKLPADSVRLIDNLNNFLIQLPKPDKDNSMVLKENLLTAAALMDEMKGMTDAGADKKGVYKCYLTNIVPLDSNSYVIQLAYMGVDAGAPVLRAGFKLIAQRRDEQYYFDSPLKRNTRGWQVKKTGSFIVYRNTNNKVSKLDTYVTKAMAFDKQLHAQNYTTEVYYCDNTVDALELLGIDYKKEYNSLPFAHLSTFEGGNNLHVIGAQPTEYAAYDLHDLWHNRLHHVASTDVINRPMDEATAYLHGGSWDISWPDIFKKFKAFAGTNHDWLSIFTAHSRFGDARAPLYTDYVIDALIAEKVEKEKGFEAVMALICSGKKEPDNAGFFKALEKEAGVTKVNFNAEVEKMVQHENPR